jgi:hypothetical protein
MRATLGQLAGSSLFRANFGPSVVALGQTMKTRRGLPKLPRSSNPRLALEPRIVFDAAIGASVADAYAIDGFKSDFERGTQLSLFMPPAVREAAAVEKQEPAKAASPDKVEKPVKALRNAADARDGVLGKDRDVENSEKMPTWPSPSPGSQAKALRSFSSIPPFRTCKHS